MDPIFVIRGLSVRVLRRTEPMRGRYIYIYRYRYILLYTCIHTYMHVCTHKCTYIYIVYIVCGYIYINIYVYVCVCVYIYIQFELMRQSENHTECNIILIYQYHDNQMKKPRNCQQVGDMARQLLLRLEDKHYKDARKHLNQNHFQFQ